MASRTWRWRQFGVLASVESSPRCPPLWLRLREYRPRYLRVLSDFQWRTNDGHLCGAFVFEQDGLLAGLDLWSIDGQTTPDAMPPLHSLVPYGTPLQVQQFIQAEAASRLGSIQALAPSLYIEACIVQKLVEDPP
jgi:hypothetical protein